MREASTIHASATPLTLTSEEEAQLQARTLSAQVQPLFASYLSSAIAGSVFALATTVVLYLLWPSRAVLFWYALHSAVRLLIPLQGRRFDRDPLALSTHAQEWRRRHAWEMLAFSVVWGLLPWAVITGENLNITAFVMIVVLGMANGGSPSLTSSMASVRGYAVPMTLGLATCLVWQGTVLGGFLALACLLNLGMSLRYSQQQHDNLLLMLRSQHENQILANRLREQVELVARSSMAKTQFLAAASHDMRQPLHAISLFGSTLERELKGRPQEANARHLMDAVRALSNSLDAMLDISQLDAGAVQPTLEAVPLQPLMQSLGAVFAAKAEERGLQLRVRSSALWVHSDAHLLQRIASNLVDNAIKYTERGGVLVLARQREQEVWLEVVDTGIGIDPEYQSRVFDEFYQINNPGRDRTLGLGLGLSVVQRLAALLSHPLRLCSRPGQGSHFRVRMPLARAPSLTSENATAAARPTPAHLPRRVLLIDDEASIASAMAALLHSFGIDLQSVQDEEQARAAIAKSRSEQSLFDVVICDMRLAHGADGLALALSLQAMAPPHTPWKTLLITGETSPDALRRIRDSGLPTLFKPVTAAALLRALGAHSD